jgi:hypothetical protein
VVFSAPASRERLFTFEEVQERLKEKIPDEDRACFIQPFENVVRFEAIRHKRGL